MKDIYCISGLGADERVFSKLNFGNHRVSFLKWEIPDKNEPLDKYAHRFLNKINSPKPILLGLSFGGMMCVEMAKQIETEKIFMISSVQTNSELPWLYRMIGKSRLNKVLPLKPYPFLEPIENYNLGVINEEEKTLAREFRQTVNPAYTNWAIDQLINWKNQRKFSNLVHIHGTADRLLPIKYVKPDFIIKGGGHFMIMNRAKEINAILEKELSSIAKN